MAEHLPPEVLAQLRIVPEQDFTCACCKKHVDCRWNPKGKDRQIPPICIQCETVKGYSWTGGPQHRTKPTGGSHMDRRIATRILALAEELANTAQRIEWSKKHGNA